MAVRSDASLYRTQLKFSPENMVVDGDIEGFENQTMTFLASVTTGPPRESSHLWKKLWMKPLKHNGAL